MGTSRRTFLKTAATTAIGVISSLQLKAFNRSNSQTFEMPKISVFSRHFHWTDWAGTAARAAEIGFDGVDLTVRPNGHVLPEHAVKDLPVAVDTIRKAGLEVYSIATAINDASDPFAENIIRTAASLGIGYYRLNWFRYDQHTPIAEQLSKMKQRFSRLYDLNEKYKIHGCYQNHAGDYFGASVWDLYEVLKDFDPAFIGCQFDIRHATVEGGNSWKNDFRMIAPYIKNQNIKDFIWTERDQKWVAASVPLGEGMVDFSTFIDMMKGSQLSGPISLHFEYPLGGADQGATQLTVGEDIVAAAMRRDLNLLRKWLS